MAKQKTIFPTDKLLKVSGFTNLQGQRYISLKYGKDRAMLPWSEFMDLAITKRSMAAQDFCIIDPALFKKLMWEVSRVDSFLPKPVTGNPGWTKSYFAFADGTVISPKGELKCRASFAPYERGFGRQGTLADWRRRIAKPLSQQSIPAFLIMAALAAPILALTDRQENFGFEIVGAGGTGKSTAQLIMASVVGPAIDCGNGTYWQSLNSTSAGLETSVLRHADLPVILDESNLMLAGGTNLRREFVRIIFQMAGGREKGRYNASHQQATRYIFCISSNEPLTEVVGHMAAATAAAAQDRLLTLTIDKARPLGIFDTLPVRYKTSSAFASDLTAAVRDHYGVAMHKFLQRLANERMEDEQATRLRISRYINAFQTKIGVDRNNGSDMRVAQAFGIVYAAGRLAIRYGVLPKSFDCKRAAVRCYQNYRQAPDSTTPFKERLENIAAREDIIRIESPDLPTLSEAALAKTGIFISNRGRRKELLIIPERMNDLFPDLKTLKKTRAYKRLNNRDDHATVKRRIRQNRTADRVYSFNL